MKKLLKITSFICALLLLGGCAGSLDTPEQVKKVVVIDAGHGKSSSLMTDEEKKTERYEYDDEKGQWGEWRHYKDGTFGEDCHGEDCARPASEDVACWYPLGYGDRETEPEINLNNALAAKKYLEEMGYEVRMTRVSDDENPSMNRRTSYCFPDNDIESEPDASLYVCLHSNAGGGRGTSYIALDGVYGQSKIPDGYIAKSNAAGEIINKKIAAATGLAENPPIPSPYLILLNKSPIPIAYIESGFYDDEEELELIRNLSDEIGRAIAEGVDEFLRTYCE